MQRAPPQFAVEPLAPGVCVWVPTAQLVITWKASPYPAAEPGNEGG